MTSSCHLTTGEAFAWLQGCSRRLVQASRCTPKSGLALHYPVANGEAYPWFYLRDYTYMYGAAPEFFPVQEVREVLVMLLGRLRSDGWAPERVELEDGAPIYRCHGSGDVIDSGPFLVSLFRSYVEESGDDALVRDDLDRFWRMLAVLPHDQTGMIWIDPQSPRTTYGFIDQIAVTGHVLFCSLLVFEALGTVQDWAGRYGRPDLAERCRSWRSALQGGLDRLWSDDAGMFFAASHDCRQADVWGSLYACRVNAATPAQRKAVLGYLATHQAQCVFRGHIRHIPEPLFWQRTLGCLPGSFQNGTYWSTPTGWYAELLEQETPGSGSRLLVELVQTFQEIGVWECITPKGDYRIRDNLSSALLPYASFKAIREREDGGAARTP